LEEIFEALSLSSQKQIKKTAFDNKVGGRGKFFEIMK
jgi:hypothetical protein